MLVFEVVVCAVCASAALASAIPLSDKLAIKKTANNSFFVIIPPPIPDYKKTSFRFFFGLALIK